MYFFQDREHVHCTNLVVRQENSIIATAVYKSSPVSSLFLSAVHIKKSLDNFLSFLFTGNGKRSIIPHFPL
jgi:hypothetical protein